MKPFYLSNQLILHLVIPMDCWELVQQTGKIQLEDWIVNGQSYDSRQREGAVLYFTRDQG